MVYFTHRQQYPAVCPVLYFSLVSISFILKCALSQWSLEAALSTDTPLAMEYQKLIRELWSSLTPIDPKTFIQGLLAYDFPFKKGEQHDASEFFVWFLDALHQDLAQKEWANGCSIITELFCGKSQSTVECLTCGTKHLTEEPFQSLALPIIDQNGLKRSLAECFRAYLSREIIAPLMPPSWVCSNCNAPRHFSKEIDLLRLPDVLVVSLNRFQWVGQESLPEKILVMIGIKKVIFSGVGVPL